MEFDCALFDVDGVLVDIRRSYNEAIKKTVELLLVDELGLFKSLESLRGRHKTSKKDSHIGRSLVRSLVTDRLILKFRQSGGFNNDTDTTYAITLVLLVNPPSSLTSGKKYLDMVVANADETGIASIESFLQRKGFRIDRYKEALVYPPGKTVESPLARLFDELFYGPDLFQKQNGANPKFTSALHKFAVEPMIKKDKVAIRSRTLQKLSKMLDGKLAMVTGRSKIAAEYSLGPLMKYFDRLGCVFLEDEPRERAKPNPYAIIHAMKMMDAKSAIYAGDSTEDLLMARRAEKHDPSLSVSFVGIYGFSPCPSDTLGRFRKSGVVAAKDVNRLPAIINRLMIN